MEKAIKAIQTFQSFQDEVEPIGISIEFAVELWNFVDMNGTVRDRGDRDVLKDWIFYEALQPEHYENRNAIWDSLCRYHPELVGV